MAVKFRRSVKKNLPPDGTPDIWPMLGLLETLERLTNKTGEKVVYEDRTGSEERRRNDRNTASAGVVVIHSVL